MNTEECMFYPEFTKASEHSQYWSNSTADSEGPTGEEDLGRRISIHTEELLGEEFNWELESVGSSHSTGGTSCKKYIAYNSWDFELKANLIPMAN